MSVCKGTAFWADMAVHQDKRGNVDKSLMEANMPCCCHLGVKVMVPDAPYEGLLAPVLESHGGIGV